MNKIKLLLVDDNKELVTMIEEYFSSNHAVEVTFTASNGEEGLNIIRNHTEEFDLIILDLIMPKVDGITVLEEMRKEGINKNVIVLTSYNSSEIIRRVSEQGVNYYLLKPFELAELEKRILEISDTKDVEHKSNQSL